ncbi:MAG: NADH-quinone oxidoreductase subunit NuoN [Alphaproteobacteria bacterium]|nr:NADH-quinone oxidoreductase subunit NuoN [Alphaproteobacteria bacterium]
MPAQFAFLFPILPELLLAVAAMGFLIFGVSGGSNRTPQISYGVILTFLAAFCMMLVYPFEGTFLGGAFTTNAYVILSKLLILGSAFLVLITSADWLEEEEHRIFEYPILVLLSVLGMMVMVSSGNLLTLYMGIELTSLPLYVLAAIRRDSLKSTESGLKYFVLGSLASGMLLFGISLVYGFSGTISLDTLQNIFDAAAQTAFENGTPLAIPAGLLAGLLLIVAGLSFKVSAVPFHMWAPDVYEGAPTPVTAFFAVAPKIAGLVVFARILLETFGGLTEYWQQLLVFIAIGSMLVGAFGAITQTNLKRLLAYSSIGHVGFALVGVASGTEAGASGLLIYLSLYLFMSVGVFGCLLMMRRKGEYVENITELAGLSKTQPLMAAAIAIFMFSMAGIPPLAGFWGKFYVFLAAIESGLFTLAIIGMLLSVVSAYYYLKVVKIMYFDEARTSFDKNASGGLRLVVTGCSLFTLLYFVYPTPIISYAKQAAAALAL